MLLSIVHTLNLYGIASEYQTEEWREFKLGERTSRSGSDTVRRRTGVFTRLIIDRRAPNQLVQYKYMLRYSAVLFTLLVSMEPRNHSRVASSARYPSGGIPLSELPTPVVPKEEDSENPVALWIWKCISYIGLNFPTKYRERLRLFEDLDPGSEEPWSTPPEYSDRGDKGKGKQKTMREKQQVIICSLIRSPC